MSNVLSLPEKGPLASASAASAASASSAGKEDKDQIDQRPRSDLGQTQVITSSDKGIFCFCLRCNFLLLSV